MNDKVDPEDVEVTVQCMTAKEIKEMVRPEFAKYPERFYPVETFKKLGFKRFQCKMSNDWYWATSEREHCGDSQYAGKYGFIGNGFKEKGAPNMTYAEAWQGFEESLTTARIPCTPIERYPIVARWRNDVDFTAAGIFCFQPYCVTGELDPPANPLICPQFCARFNDLDNIGITGRHYSGFIMVGMQVFNSKDNWKFFKDETVEFNFRWLTETLKVPPEEISFVEDVWAGGGNMGPSIEYFIRGLEVGNMVFMQYKTFHDGSREELDIKVIDVGIGLERVVWLVNGSPTSYCDTFAQAYQYMLGVTKIDPHPDIWEKFGPYSCTLNVDEVDDMDKTWKDISDKIGVDVDSVKKAIQPMKELYIILDHTRTILITISDGALPSNVGGGGNVRNILRRVFSILKKNDWWDKFGMEGFLEIFEWHKKDLEGIYGKFPRYKSFDEIIKVEYDRWLMNDDESVKKLDKVIKQRKGKLTIDDWIMGMQSYGIPADKIADIVKAPIPSNLYYEIALRQERTAKAAEVVLYRTAHLPETENLYYDDAELMEFDATVVEVFKNVTQKQLPNIVIFDRSAIYPTSGGQQHDNGTVTFAGVAGEYNIIDAVKVGKCVLHVLDRPLEGYLELYKGKKVHVKLDAERRRQLMAHHTGTHIIFAACRRVLGPHVWQHGAKKTTEQAHLDITHYQSLSKEQERDIENQANRIINDCTGINKSTMNKKEAELQYGFHLYQGGIVPGNELRVVNIEGVDTEACCGTHCDNTAEVGWVKLLKTSRISDGIVRLYYVAQERAIELMNKEQDIMNQLCSTWGVDNSQILPTATRFFNDYKKLSAVTKKQDVQILSLQAKLVLSGDAPIYFTKSDQDAPTLYFAQLPQFADKLKAKNKGVVYMGDNFVIGIIGNKTSDALITALEGACKEMSKNKAVKTVKKVDVKFDFKIKGQKPVVTKEICFFNITGADFKEDKIQKILSDNGGVSMD